MQITSAIITLHMSWFWKIIITIIAHITDSLSHAIINIFYWTLGKEYVKQYHKMFGVHHLRGRNLLYFVVFLENIALFPLSFRLFLSLYSQRQLAGTPREEQEWPCGVRAPAAGGAPASCVSLCLLPSLNPHGIRAPRPWTRDTHQLVEFWKARERSKKECSRGEAETAPLGCVRLSPRAGRPRLPEGRWWEQAASWERAPSALLWNPLSSLGPDSSVLTCSGQILPTVPSELSLVLPPGEGTSRLAACPSRWMLWTRSLGSRLLGPS